MFEKESLFINAIKYDNQLKCDYKKLNNDQIISTNNFSFITDADILPNDIAIKINSSQEETNHTYIASLLLNDTAKLIDNKSSSKLKDCDITKFNEELDIVVLKTTLFETKNYFDKTGIDYIYSAFHILSLHLEQNILKNQIVTLLHNSKAFIVVVDKESNVIYNDVIDLPKFNEIQKTHFYEDDVQRQKLFDEIYYLKVYEAITNSINKFYEEAKDSFIEKVTILYSLKQLTNDDIDKLSDDMLLDIEYHPINIDEEVFELIKNKHVNKSFIKARPKKTKKNFSTNFIFAGLIFIMVLGFYYVYKNFDSIYNQDTTIQKADNKNFLLPDHININHKIKQNLELAIKNVPYDMVLDTLTLKEESLKLEGTLLKNDSFIKSIKPSYENIYNDINIKFLEEDKKTLVKVEVTLDDKEESAIAIQPKVNYINDEFIPAVGVTEQLTVLLGESSKVTFNSSKNNDFTKFIYDVDVLVNSPMEFLNKIDEINNEFYSIVLTYPIVFEKDDTKLKVSFQVVYNQVRK